MGYQCLEIAIARAGRGSLERSHLSSGPKYLRRSFTSHWKGSWYQRIGEVLSALQLGHHVVAREVESRLRLWCIAVEDFKARDHLCLDSLSIFQIKVRISAKSLFLRFSILVGLSVSPGHAIRVSFCHLTSEVGPVRTRILLRKASSHKRR